MAPNCFQSRTLFRSPDFCTENPPQVLYTSFLFYTLFFTSFYLRQIIQNRKGYKEKYNEKLQSDPL